MTVRRAMTTDVISIHCDNHLFGAQRLMDWEGIRHLPVVDDEGLLVGLLTEHTLLRHWSDRESERKLWEQPVHEVMKTALRVVEPNTPADEAARILRDEAIDCLPVVSGRRLTGILTDHDLQIDRAIDLNCVSGLRT